MSDKILLAHYMAWFGKESEPLWHWKGLGDPTPFKADEDSQTRRLSIASHDYPLREPYRSNNASVVLEHLREMKDGGIQGVIVNWYGVGAPSVNGQAYHDYADIHRATAVVLEQVAKEGMKFALCLDGTALDEVEKLHKSDSTAYPETTADYAKRSLGVACTEFFISRAYIRDAGRPLLLQFGFSQAFAGWPALLASLPVGCAERPRLVVQGAIGTRHWAEGRFVWPEVRLAGECDVAKPWHEVEADLAAFYSSAEISKDTIVIGAAFPGFRDIYREDNRPGLHRQIIHRAGGDTYRRTLRLALSQPHVKYVQIATWNDWSEGTHIEPSVRHGLRELCSTRQVLQEYGLA